MLCRPRLVLFISCLIAISSLLLTAQDDVGWRISPERINIQMGQDRRLQLLDDSAQELRGAIWSVDDSELAEIEEVDGLAVVHAKHVGTVKVSATLAGETRVREIKIWSALRAMPLGTTNYGLHPIGREVGDIPAVPTGDGPTVFSLEQTADGNTYLRADDEDGIQIWTWLMPGKVHDVALICGDWLGGAILSSSLEDSYTIYAVGKDGKLRWDRHVAGVRKGFAVSTEHLVHLLNQSRDGTKTTVIGIGEENGAKWFELSLPVSQEKQINVRQVGSKLECASSTVTNPMRTHISRIMVNMDGFAYVAFTESDWAIRAGECTPGHALTPEAVSLTRDDKLMLWQIHPEGSYRAILVENHKTKQPLSVPLTSDVPTGALVTDNMNGTLISVRVSHNVPSSGTGSGADEYVYRVSQAGELVFKFLLPRYSGLLADEMVIGEDNVAFATRGPLLVAFNLVNGKELWRWESTESAISVFAALANGDCLVQTPTALVEVASSTKAKEVAKGKAMMGWQGQMYLKHN